MGTLTEFTVSLQQIFDVVDHFLPAVSGYFDDAGVHANGVFRAGFHTEAAKHTNAEIDIESGGEFFDVRIWVFASHDVNASMSLTLSLVLVSVATLISLGPSVALSEMDN